MTTREGFAAATGSPLPPRDAPPRRSPQRDGIIRRLLAGQSYKQIAREMNISYGSVGGRAAQIYRKHGVPNREELCRAYQKTCASGRPSFAK